MPRGRPRLNTRPIPIDEPIVPDASALEDDSGPTADELAYASRIAEMAKRKDQEIAEKKAAAARSQTMRSDIRTDMRSEEPRVRKRRGIYAQDKFRIDMEEIPDGASYEWKRVTSMGQNDPAYDVEMLEQGWRPVDVDRHPNFMPPGYKGPIIRGGLMLMERPMELTKEAQREQYDAARGMVDAKLAQLGEAPAGTLDRVNGKSGPLVDIKTNIEGPTPFEIPN